MKPKYGLKKRIRFLKDGETFEGRIVEITLFRRESEEKNSYGYRIQSPNGKDFIYIGEDQVI